MEYQAMLSKAWSILKRQRALWLFGFLSACAGGSYGRMGIPSFNFQVPATTQREQSFSGMEGQHLESFFHQLGQVPAGVWVLLGVGLLLVLFVWLVLMLALRSFAQGGLLGGLGQIVAAERDGGESQVLRVKDVVEQGKALFGRLFLFNLLIGGGVWAVIVIAVLGLIVLAMLTMGIGIVCLIPLFVLAIPVVWLLSVYLELVLLSLALDEPQVASTWGRIKAAFGKGADLLKGHFWDAVVVALLVWLINILAGLAMVAVLVVLLMVLWGPLVAFGVLAHATGWLVTLLVLLGIVGGGVALLVFLGLAGLLETYTQSVWVLAFEQWRALDAVQGEALPPSDPGPLPAQA